MKYYIIYKKDEFIGYATDKKLLNNFLKNRKGTYKILKLNDSEISDDIKKSFTFEEYGLTEYANYYTCNDTVLFGYEIVEMEDLIHKDITILQSLINILLKDTKYIRLTDDEKKMIKYSFRQILEITEPILGDTEVIYDEIITIKKYFYNRYLPFKKKFLKHIGNSFIDNS